MLEVWSARTQIRLLIVRIGGRILWLMILDQLRKDEEVEFIYNIAYGHRYQWHRCCQLMTSSPKSADKHLPSEIKLLSLPCMNRLKDGNDIHFRDKATATREAPRLCATAPSYDGTYVVRSNFPVDKGSGQFDILPFKPHRRSCMHSSRLRLSG